jgi:nitrite reductase/ring-hydroxylating ferredoxin subunit
MEPNRSVPLVTLLILSLLLPDVSPFSLATRRSSMSMRIKGSLSKVTGDGGSKKGSNEFLGNDGSKKDNWVPVQGVKSLAELPLQEDSKVNLVDTMAPQLIDPRVNPTGAVGVINYKGKTYCISPSCSSCKIPLTKAKVLQPNAETKNQHPRIECEFCGATYNAKTGEVLNDASSDRGLMGAVVKGLFSSKEKQALPTYDLGEANGKVVINLPL